MKPLQAGGYLFKRFEPFSLRTIGSRKRIGVYHGVDLQNRYTLVFVVDKKSRVLRKEVREWFEIKTKIEHHYGYRILQNIVLLHAPICSKAKALLESEGWSLVTV
ncbi:hypothetical protein [Hydrogenimonas urashimensis]|uniref:hypothetical protein n=1 Tax=Hydrogenimonas urashimensis TaxID=2740515 RepID=UPI001916B912|nr:hypothetical protein [Hydrogenimonas urashimensis]